MRIKINLAGNNIVLPNNTQHLVNSYFHKCLGHNNTYHDLYSDYSISSIQGGYLDIKNKSLIINNAFIIVSSFDDTMISKLVIGIMNNKSFYDGISVVNIEPMQEELFYNGYNHFRTLTPFLIRQNNKEITTNDFSSLEEMSEFVNLITINKLSKISSKHNLNLKLDFSIKIEWCHSIRRFMKPNCRAMYVNNCGFTFIGSKKEASLLYDIGIGQSTGSGFGCIYKSENNFIYR